MTLGTNGICMNVLKYFGDKNLYEISVAVASCLSNALILQSPLQNLTNQM